MILCRSRKLKEATKPNPPLLKNGSKRFTKLKPVLKHNGALQKEDQEEREVRVHEGRGGEDG